MFEPKQLPILLFWLLKNETVKHVVWTHVETLHNNPHNFKKSNFTQAFQGLNLCENSEVRCC